MPANTLSPGIFIEETTTQPGAITSSSPSILGIVGFTPQGVENKATLVTARTYKDVFGDLSANSYLGYVLAGFFNEGGQQAYVVRVCPSDAALASGKILSKTYNQALTAFTGGAPDGTIATFAATSAASQLKDNLGGSPLVPGSVSFKWRALGTPVVAGPLKTRDGVTSVTSDGAIASFEFRIATASLPVYEPGLLSVVPGTVTLNWSSVGPASKTLVIAAPVSGTTSTATGSGATVVFDHATGFGSISFASNFPLISTLSMDFTPATATLTTGLDTSGTWAATTPLTSGSVTLADGAFTFTCVNTTATRPHNKSPILANYKIYAWSVSATGKGVWGNNLQIVISPYDTLQSSTVAPTQFNVAVQLKDSAGVYQTVESYEGLSLSDTTSSAYLPTVINELSDVIAVSTTAAGNEPPGELTGFTNVYYIGGGDSSVGGKTFASFTAPSTATSKIQKRSVVVTYTKSSDASVVTFTDDGQGGFTGAAVSSGTIDYNARTVTLVLTDTVKTGTLVSFSYRETAEEATHTELLGDTTRAGLAGTDGTFTSGTYGVAQLTTSSLSSTYSGLYALNKVDDILQVVVPDLTGDVTATADLLTYAAGRALLPSGADRFVILSTPKNYTAASAVDWLQYKIGSRSKYAAIYWPWVKVSDPLASAVGTGTRYKTIPPTGHVMGVYARTDNNKNVGKAPAGITDGQLTSVIDLELAVTRDDTDLVYPKFINPLVNWVQTGKAVWGARTFASESAWKYIQARRLFMYVERAIWNNTHWIVFENNGPDLWLRIKGQLNGYLGGLFAQGYFAGSTPAKAFFVICDETNNTPDSIAQGKVNIDVGIAPNKPAEFVVFRMSQITT